MAQLYAVEAMIAATLYIKADSEAEAVAKARGVVGAGLEVADDGGEVEISGLMFDDPELPEISFTPAMTVHAVAAHHAEPWGLYAKERAERTLD